MFENSLVISRVAHIPTTKRWTIAGSIAVQSLLAALVIAVPLLHPAALPFEITPPSVLAPVIPKPPVPVHVQQSATASSATALPATAPTRPLLPPRLHPGTASTPPEIAELSLGNSMSNPLANIIDEGTGHGPAVIVRPELPSGPLHVSQGITAGMLLSPIQPIYPAIAKAAGVQGTVIVAAIISRTGTIESLEVISGPQMLRGAAVDAIRAAKYRPYKLNGQPTDVQTTITVNFRIGG